MHHTAGGETLQYVGGKCRWCGNIHEFVCPQIKALEYHADGVTLKRVEFHEPKALLAEWLPHPPGTVVYRGKI